MILMNYYQVKLTKHLLEHKQTIQVLTVFWTGLVAYLCLTSTESLPSVEVLKFDKVGHFTFHFGITTLWFFEFTAACNASTVRLGTELSIKTAFTLWSII